MYFRIDNLSDEQMKSMFPPIEIETDDEKVTEVIRKRGFLAEFKNKQTENKPFVVFESYEGEDKLFCFMYFTKPGSEGLIMVTGTPYLCVVDFLKILFWTRCNTGKKNMLGYLRAY